MGSRKKKVTGKQVTDFFFKVTDKKSQEKKSEKKSQKKSHTLTHKHARARTMHTHMQRARHQLTKNKIVLEGSIHKIQLN